MSIYAIGDLHLSLENKVIPGEWDQVSQYKPMDCFGSKWDRHFEKIYKNWNKIVSDRDTVMIPGDISWAMKLKDIQYDFDFISKLPGKKILIKGNHDYWWGGISKVRSRLPENTFALQYDSIKVEGVSIGGTRGWVLPSSNNEEIDEQDEKIYRREIMRLEMSLKSMENNNNQKLVMFHYMPVNERHEKNEFIELLIDYKVDTCVYGHLHGKESHKIRIAGEKWGINFQLVSADYLNFTPELIYSQD